RSPPTRAAVGRLEDHAMKGLLLGFRAHRGFGRRLRSLRAADPESTPRASADERQIGPGTDGDGLPRPAAVDSAVQAGAGDGPASAIVIEMERVDPWRPRIGIGGHERGLVPLAAKRQMKS